MVSFENFVKSILIAYQNQKLHLVFASLSKSLTTQPQLLYSLKVTREAAAANGWVAAARGAARCGGSLQPRLYSAALLSI